MDLLDKEVEIQNELLDFVREKVAFNVLLVDEMNLFEKLALAHLDII